MEDKWKYNGKEKVEDMALGWYEYGFRWYAPELARFISVDPLATKFPHWTTYQFTGNSPIANIDLDGLEPVDVVTKENKNEFNFPISWESYMPWKDLLKLRPSQNIVDETSERISGLEVQKIEDAHGADINLDYYSVQIKKLPLGMTSEQLLYHIRTNFERFKTNGGSDFNALNANEKTKWQSKNYLGTVMIFGAYLGPVRLDQVAVIASDAAPNYWVFSTVSTDKTWGHAVSGNRQFGISTSTDENGNVNYTFFTRGADRAHNYVDASTSMLVFHGAEKLWNAVMDNVIDYVNGNGGSATKGQTISKRINWSPLYIK